MTRTLTAEKALVAVALLALLGAVFAHTFVLFFQGWHDEENMHGVAVVPIVVFLIWLNWARLKKTPIRPSVRAGMTVLGTALLVQVAGIWLGLERSIGYAFVLAVVGLCLYFLGKPMTRELAFPLAFLLFMVPTPGGVLDIISAPLQVLSARMAVALAGLSGVAVQNEGVNLLIPAKHIAFEVAVACSGLHSLTAMCMLAALMAYFITIPLPYKWGLFALAIPLALLGNIVRIYLVLMVANHYGQTAGSAFHDGLVGKLVPFTLAFLVLIGLGRLIEWRLTRPPMPPAPPTDAVPLEAL
jgi:exosortase